MEASVPIAIWCDPFTFVISDVKRKGAKHELTALVRLVYKGKMCDSLVNFQSEKSREEFAQQAQEQTGATALLVVDCLVREIPEPVVAVTEALKTVMAGDAVPQVTGEAREDAMEFLKDPVLLKRVDGDFGALGLARERVGARLLYLSAISRKLPRPVSVLVKGISSAGKSSLVEKVIQLCPPEDVHPYSRISATALDNMRKGALRHKLLVIFEYAGAEASDYSIRTIQSERVLRIAVSEKSAQTGRWETEIRTVEGPVAVFLTTTRTNLNEENATRMLEVYADETQEQTAEIHKVQRRDVDPAWVAKGSEVEEIIARHQNAQRLLRPLKVVIPFHEHITFPIDRVRYRRDFPQFLYLIAAVAFLHQYQREIRCYGEVGCIVAQLEDYAVAHDLMVEYLRRSGADVPLRSLELLEAAKQLVGSITRRALEEHLGWGMEEVKRYLKPLLEREYLACAQEGRKGVTHVYEVVEVATSDRPGVRGLLSPQELEEAVRSCAACVDASQQLTTQEDKELQQVGELGETGAREREPQRPGLIPERIAPSPQPIVIDRPAVG